MHQKRWTRKKLFSFSILVCVAIFLLVEILFRLLFWQQMKPFHTTVYVQGSPLQLDDSALVFRNRPFYLDHQRKYQNNENGMRGKPGDVFMPVKDSNDFWVFLFGASAIEGMGSNKDGEWLDITGVTDHGYNENIAFFLERELQQKMPGKKVRVFNAANSGYTIHQSFMRYAAQDADMDWIISMDGQNDPALLGPGQLVMDSVREEWEQNPTNSFPLSVIIPITQHSAFVNRMKQSIFHIKQNRRIREARENGFPRSQYWFSRPQAIRYRSADDSTARALDSFFNALHRFDSTLTARNQKHLLLLQPHIIFRDSSVMTTTERALLNYYAGRPGNASTNGFLRDMRRRFVTEKFSDSTSVQLLDATDTMRIPVFVDYCHFTAQANSVIARMLANHIIEHNQRP